MKRIWLVSLLLIIVAFPSLASILTDDRTISVTGTGVVKVEPDTASVRLGVEVSKKTAQEAQAGNAEIMQKILSTMEKTGIAKDKIQTSGFNVWPEMKYEPNQPPKIVGYRCSNQVSVTIEDLSKISKAIDAGIGAGANNVQGVQFSRKDNLEFKKQALDKAVKEASSKAQAIASAAGLKIKWVKNIIESGAAVPPPQAELLSLRAMGAGGAETPISPGLIEVRGSVTITYKVE
jgi:hypothetical protein